MKLPSELLNVSSVLAPLVSLGRQFHSFGALTAKEFSKRVIDLAGILRTWERWYVSSNSHSSEVVFVLKRDTNIIVSQIVEYLPSVN